MSNINKEFNEWLETVMSVDRESLPPYTTDPRKNLKYVSQFFNEIKSFCSKTNPNLVGEVLWNLVGDATFIAIPIENIEISTEDFNIFLDSLFNLFANYLQFNCSNKMGSLSKSETKLDSLTYMFWDVLPYAPCSSGNAVLVRRNLDIIRTMSRILEIPSVACQESALHGLNHWYYEFPKEVKGAIDSFIENHKEISTELRQYALTAQAGEAQ